MRSPYNLNDSYTDASYVIQQIRYELQKITKQYEISAIEVHQPYTRKELESEMASITNG